MRIQIHSHVTYIITKCIFKKRTGEHKSLPTFSITFFIYFSRFAFEHYDSSGGQLSHQAASHSLPQGFRRLGSQPGALSREIRPGEDGRPGAILAEEPLLCLPPGIAGPRQGLTLPVPAVIFYR